MAPEEKPYRVYKGGRVKGKVPTASRKARVQPPRKRAGSGGGNRLRLGGQGRFRLSLPKLPPWRRTIVLGLIVFIVLFVVWAITSYFAFSSGVSDANKQAFYLDNARKVYGVSA